MIKIYDKFKRNKTIKKIKDKAGWLKDYIILALIALVAYLIFNYPVPYYILAPGGIVNASDKYSIENIENDSSFYLTYVTEYQGTVASYLLGIFNKDYELVKIESDEEIKTVNKQDSLRDELLLKESQVLSTYNAYKLAGREVKLTENGYYVRYLADFAKTDLIIGDKIISINDVVVNSEEELLDLISSYRANEEIKLKVISNNKEVIKKALVVNIDGVSKIGIGIITDYIIETNPDITFKFDKDENGSSAGLIMTLDIYNTLIDEDLTNGLLIAGTGTVDVEGNVGSIGGVDYKIKAAVKEKADIFFVPAGDNYDEAKKIVDENNYDINLIKVNTVTDAVDYLKNVS